MCHVCKDNRQVSAWLEVTACTLNRLQYIVLQDMFNHAAAGLQQISCVTVEQLTAGPGLMQPFSKSYCKLALQPFLVA